MDSRCLNFPASRSAGANALAYIARDVPIANHGGQRLAEPGVSFAIELLDLCLD